MIRYLPPKCTAGFASLLVRSKRREPLPPASIIATILFVFIKLLPLYSLIISVNLSYISYNNTECRNIDAVMDVVIEAVAVKDDLVFIAVGIDMVEDARIDEDP